MVVVEAGEEVGDRQAELADDHLPVRVGDQRELVVLLADARGQRGAEQHLVHLVAGVAQAVLDEVEGDRVDLASVGSGVVAVSTMRAMSAQPSFAAGSGDEQVAATGATVAAWPGRTRVVESISVTIAGPCDDVAGAQRGAVVDVGRHALAPDVDRACSRTRRRRGRGRRPRSVDGGDVGRGPLTVARALTSSWSTVEQEAEQPLVLGVEGCASRSSAVSRDRRRASRVDVDRDLEALAVVADVDLVA